MFLAISAQYNSKAQENGHEWGEIVPGCGQLIKTGAREFALVTADDSRQQDLILGGKSS